jgi:hypothetical protein
MVTCRIEVNSLNGDPINGITIVPLELRDEWGGQLTGNNNK